MLAASDLRTAFAHQLGHLLGADHDRFDCQQGSDRQRSNFGFVSVASGVRTIMASDLACNAAGVECPALPYWSNPDVSHNGTRLGVPAGQPDAADNSRAIVEGAERVAAFRAGRDSSLTVSVQLPLISSFR